MASIQRKYKEAQNGSSPRPGRSRPSRRHHHLSFTFKLKFQFNCFCALSMASARPGLIYNSDAPAELKIGLKFFMATTRFAFAPRPSPSYLRVPFTLLNIPPLTFPFPRHDHKLSAYSQRILFIGMPFLSTRSNLYLSPCPCSLRVSIYSFDV